MQENVHIIRKHKGKHELILLKYELMKAYDWFEWGFLDKVLEAWGFSVCTLGSSLTIVSVQLHLICWLTVLKLGL